MTLEIWIAVGCFQTRFCGVVRLGAILAIMLLVFGSAAQAQTRTWDGGGADNNWSTAGNWSSDNVPDGTGGSRVVHRMTRLVRPSSRRICLRT